MCLVLCSLPCFGLFRGVSANQLSSVQFVDHVFLAGSFSLLLFGLFIVPLFLYLVWFGLVVYEISFCVL